MATIAVDCGYHIHREPGPRLLESVYELLLFDSLIQRGLAVERQRPIAVKYNGRVFDAAFKADLLIEGRLLIELKSVEQLSPLHAKQLLTYLRLMQMPLGLLINFGAVSYREAVNRMVNNYAGG